MDGDTPVFAVSVLILTDTVGSEPALAVPRTHALFHGVCDEDNLVVTGDFAEPASSGLGSGQCP